MVSQTSTPTHCDHTFTHADFRVSPPRMLGTWETQENRTTGQRRVACRVCGKLYGYVKAEKAGENNKNEKVT